MEDPSDRPKENPPQKKKCIGVNDSKHIKQEPPDIDDVKNELFEFEANETIFENDPFDVSFNVWSLLVNRCRFLLQEEHGYSQMNSHLLGKILIKETNELLQEIVTFFQDCCNPLNQEECYSDIVLEVDGLLVNCLPCHPQNVKCHYKICNDIPKAYLETLFSPLPSEIEESPMKEEFDLPFAPSDEVETKNNILNDKKVKRSKPGKKPGVKDKEKKVHFCELCGKTFKYRKDYKEHVSAVHEKKKPYKCRDCGVAYGHRKTLVIHRRKGKCSETGSNKNKLIKWGKKADDPKCVHPDCVGKEYPRFTYAGIMIHMIDHHSPGPDDSKNHQCPDCPMRFPMPMVLKYHQEKAHGGKNEVCTHCGKVVANMKKHLLVHSTEKKYQCDKCDYRSHHKETLKRHMFIHSEDPNDGRKHICNICHKTWYTKTDLKEHLMVHAGIKPYKCKLCNSAFSNFSGHRQHMMKTHGVKFTCDLCGHDSSSMKGLDIHKRDKHGIPL